MQAANINSMRSWRLTYGCLAVGCLAFSAAGQAWADDDHHGRRNTSFHLDVNIGTASPVAVPAPVQTPYIVETRGPVHEAFAEPVVYDSTAGLVVPRRPPALIGETPPTQCPQGDDVVWIAGYWGWDDDRNDFIWVSGIWRNMPPDRQFVPGYWREAPGGHQWVSGFWQADRVDTVEYLPPPPESFDTGPVGAPPHSNHIWVSGLWVWRDTGYLWRPGYWIAPQENWVWVPDRYVWTPRGHLFVNGYWDHAVVRRGVLFAPVYVAPTVLAQPAFVYTPSVVVNLSVLGGDMFARPHYHHYYFGDYYDQSYFRSGIYPVVSFHNSRYGYDPIFARHVVTQGVAPSECIRRVRDYYHHRRDHAEARPPRTYTDFQRWTARHEVDPHLRRQFTMAQPLSEVASRSDSPVRFRSIEQNRIDEHRQTVTQTRQYQEKRRRLEMERAQPTPTASISIPSNRVSEVRPAQSTGAGQVTMVDRGRPVTPSRSSSHTVAPGQTPSRTVTRSQTPARTVAPGQSKGPTNNVQPGPTRLQLPKSPLVSRKRGPFDLLKASPPSKPKASATEPNVRPGTRTGIRRDPQE
jgi:hypothetical protein